MALNPRRSHPWLARLHLLLRLLGLTGLLVAVAGVVLAHVQKLLTNPDGTLRDPRLVLEEAMQDEGLKPVSAYLFVAGVGALLIALLVEVAVAIRLTAARRSATRANAVLQAALAVALLAGLNVYSFFHYERIDTNRPDREGEKPFTLPAELTDQLKKLRGETSIVILQQERSTGSRDMQASRKSKAYQKAADAVVVEKVRDFADLLRDFSGTRFRVVLLDDEQKEFQRKVDEVTKNRPKLADAIQSAPGSSIIFYAAEGSEKDPEKRAHVQRLTFEDFLQLNREASRKANKDKGNLVLLKKGVEPLLLRILNLEEKRPRVGILVVHEVFTTDSSEEALGLAGLKKTLIENGYDVENIIAKRDLEPDDATGTWTWSPGADVLADSKYLSLRSVEESFPISLVFLRDQKLRWTQQKRQVERLKVDGVRITEEDKSEALARAEGQIAEYQKQIDRLNKRQAEVKTELGSMDADLVGQLQRTTDIQGKLNRVLADCDLLLIPRLSMFSTGRGFFDAQGLFRLDDVHINAIKGFLKEGKPVLASLGSVLNPRGDQDSLEKLLEELHIRLGKKTVVFNVQQEEYAKQQASRFAAGSGEVPPLDFETPPRELLASTALEPAPLHDNALRLNLAREREARGPELDLRLRYPRPVYYDADRGGRLKRYGGALAVLAATPLNPLGFLTAHSIEPEKRKPLETAPQFLWTTQHCWIDSQPLPTRTRPVPQFEEPKKDDPTKGTLDETRTGPFPVGVAIQATLPEKWYAGSSGKPATARIAVIGHGAVFVDPELPPARQALLVQTCNWLLDRDVRGGKDRESPAPVAAIWEYPRLELPPQEKDLWLWVGRLGLPLLFLYLGVIVLLVRRAR